MKLTNKDNMIIDLLNIKDDLTKLRTELIKPSGSMLYAMVNDGGITVKITDALTNIVEALQILDFYPKGQVYGETIFREKYI